jgi:hypothetical protein
MCACRYATRCRPPPAVGFLTGSHLHRVGTSLVSIMVVVCFTIMCAKYNQTVCCQSSTGKCTTTATATHCSAKVAINALLHVACMLCTLQVLRSQPYLTTGQCYNSLSTCMPCRQNPTRGGNNINQNQQPWAASTGWCQPECSMLV